MLTWCCGRSAFIGVCIGSVVWLCVRRYRLLSGKHVPFQLPLPFWMILSNWRHPASMLYRLMAVIRFNLRAFLPMNKSFTACICHRMKEWHVFAYVWVVQLLAKLFHGLLYHSKHCIDTGYLDVAYQIIVWIHCDVSACLWRERDALRLDFAFFWGYSQALQVSRHRSKARSRSSCQQIHPRKLVIVLRCHLP